MRNQTVLLFCTHVIAVFLSPLSVPKISLDANTYEFKDIETIEVNDNFLDISIDSSVIEIDNKNFLIREHFKRFIRDEICRVSRKLSLMPPRDAQRDLERKVKNIDFRRLDASSGRLIPVDSPLCD